MWRRLAKCFSCGRKSSERKRSGSSEKNNDEDADDKCADNKLNKDTTQNDVKLDTTEPKLAPKEEDDAFEEEKVVGDKDIAEESRNIDQVENIDDGHASETVILNRKPIATVANEIEQVDEQVSEVQQVNDVCYSPERKDAVVSNSFDKINKIKCEEVKKVQPQSDPSFNASGNVEENGITEDLAISNAVDDILGALDNILAKEKTGSTASDIKTINIKQLSSKPVTTGNVAAQENSIASITTLDNILVEDDTENTANENKTISTKPVTSAESQPSPHESLIPSIDTPEAPDNILTKRDTENTANGIETISNKPVVSAGSQSFITSVGIESITQESSIPSIERHDDILAKDDIENTTNEINTISSKPVTIGNVATESVTQESSMQSIETHDNILAKDGTINTMNEIDTESKKPLDVATESVTQESSMPTIERHDNILAKDGTINTMNEIDTKSQKPLDVATESVTQESSMPTIERHDNNIAKDDTKVTVNEIHTKSHKAISSLATESGNQECSIPSIIVTEPVIEQDIAVLDQEIPTNDHIETIENVDMAIDLPNEHEIVNENSMSTQQSNKRHSLVMVEKFSEELSNTVIGAVIQKSDDLIIDNAENNYWRFSDVLADSIVNTVLEYSNQIIDENSNFGLNQESVDEHDVTTQDDAEEVQSDNESCSIEELDDELSFDDLNDYAKRLSEHIITNVLNDQDDVDRQCKRRDSISAEVYISRLAENIISKAITKANGCVNGQSKTTEELLDSMVTKIVQNVLQSAMTKMKDHTSNGLEHHHGDLPDHHSESPDHHGDLPDHHGDLPDHHGDSLDHHGESLDHHGDVPNGAVSPDGKLQSKWLSEDDLDELYESDVSVEESEPIMANNLTDQQQTTNEMSFLRPHNDRLNQEEKTKWRSSLIEDLDEELEFDDEDDSVCEEGTSKTVVISEAISLDEDIKDDIETPTAKVSNGPAKSTVSRQSRLRSVDSTPTLVFDNGSGFLKVGYSTDSVPREIIPSVVGTPLRYSQDISGMEYSSRPGLVFGEIALGKAGVLHNDYPLKPELVEKWSDVEGLWGYVLNEVLNFAEHPECPILLTQSAGNAKKNTEKLAEIMFEKFHFPSLFIACQPALALYSMGYTTGVSFCSGFSRSQAAVVYEGHVLPHTVRQLDIAGYQLTETLKKLLMSVQGVGFRGSSHWKIVDDIKRKMAFVSSDFQADVKRYKTQEDLHEPYELPDGQVIDVGLERCGCAETLFRPAELGLSQPPAHMLIVDAVQSCDEELQESCYKAAGISGGTTLLKGFPERLEQELRETDRKFKNVIVPEHRELCTWLGGAVQASLSTFQEMVVDVDEYAETGVRVVHSKCF